MRPRERPNLSESQLPYPLRLTGPASLRGSKSGRALRFQLPYIEYSRFVSEVAVLLLLMQEPASETIYIPTRAARISRLEIRLFAQL